MAMEITDSNFEEEVTKSSIPVLVDFWAPWCGPCKMLAPTLDELSKEYEGRVKISKVNVDENQAKAGEYNVTSIPALKLFKNGKLIDEMVGIVPKKTIMKKLHKIL
ncbi:MAG: thioredoxin [bacterium]|nr:thioredoxin [bacterium]